MPLDYYRSNNADDSKGKTWGMEGNNFFILLGAIALGVLIANEIGQSGGGVSAALITGVVPLILAGIWVFGFRQGKPPHYDVDFFWNLIHGKKWEAAEPHFLQNEARSYRRAHTAETLNRDLFQLKTEEKK